jgi:HAE1 family hydrophobic/amphiphilic exporter-1
VILRSVYDTLVRHPVAVSMVTIAALVFGWVSYHRLAVELMPDLSYPTLTVRTTYEGAAPGEVEAQISRPIEESLATLDGLVSLESRSRAGASDVLLGFDWGTDMGKASQSVREALLVTPLPDEADRPLLLHFDPSLDPILRIAVAFDEEHAPEDREKALGQLRAFADDELRRELEGLDGVAAVRVEGGLEAEVRVEVREDWLAARGVTLDQVRAAIAAENVNLAGGSVLHGDTEYLVRTLNEYTVAGDLERLGIRRDDGVVVQLSEVAEIRTTYKDQVVVSRLDGVDAVELEVLRAAGSNIVGVADAVRARLFGTGVADPMTGDVDEGLSADLPEGVTVRVLDDQAEFISEAIDNLVGTAWLGGALAIGVLFLFLRDFRATAIIGLSIPASVLAAFAPLYLGGVSLNLMSLGGLALGVGMLVDNAVVVLEAVSRHVEQGVGRAEAAVTGASEVAAAVTASTLTTVAVFLPMAFVEGVAGQLFGDLAMAVVWSLLASLVVALFLVPTLAALEAPDGTDVGGEAVLVWRGPGRVRRAIDYTIRAPFTAVKEDLRWVRARRRRWPLAPWFAARVLGEVLVRAVTLAAALGLVVAAGAAFGLWRFVLVPAGRLAVRGALGFERVYGGFAAGYAGLLDRTLRAPFAVAGAAVLGVVFTVGVASWLGTELLPTVHQGRFVLEARLPVGTPLAATDRAIRAAEDVVRRHPDVESAYVVVGADVRADAKPDEGPNTAQIRVTLRDEAHGPAREDALAEALRDAVSAAAPELELRVTRPSLFSVETPLEVVVTGYDLDALKAVGEDVVAELDGVEGLRDVQSSLTRGHPEIVIEYDRQLLLRFGLDPATVAERVRDKVQGARATRLRQGDRRLDLRVQLVEADRQSVGELRSINVNPNLVPPIPLDVVADVREVEGPSEIRRVDQQRAVVIGANVAGFDLGSTSAEVARRLRGIPLGDGMVWRLGGQSTEMDESLASLQFALLLAVFLVYVIMASMFENLAQPFVILFTVPLAAVGVAGSLAVAGLPVSVVALLGVIVLAGVVVNNAIVLVDAVNQLRDEGHPAVEAMRIGAATRLRPILITTATTVLGLAPLAFGFGSGAEIQQPLAVTVIGGLTTSTLLTLVVIPVGYLAITRERRSPALAPATDGAAR